MPLKVIPDTISSHYHPFKLHINQTNYHTHYMYTHITPERIKKVRKRLKKIRKKLGRLRYFAYLYNIK